MLKEEIKTLNIDLNTKSSNIVVQKAKDLTLEERLGGFGKAVHDLAKFQESHGPIKDAFDSENLLCVGTGVLTGQKVMTAKRGIFATFSPLETSLAGTPGIAYSTASGNFGSALKSTGFDDLLITGKLEVPSILVLNNNQLEIRETPELIGKTTSEKMQILKQYYPEASSAVIGPAGENLVRYASVAISTQDEEHMRFAGRMGMGAVMGSKNILGIVAQGDAPKLELENTKDLNLEIANGKGSSKYKLEGTWFANIKTQPKAGSGVFNNFSKAYDPRVEEIQKEKILEKGYKIKDKGCLGCGIKCGKYLEDSEGNVLGKKDYEPGALFGTNLGLYKEEEVMELISIADKQGLDSISAGTCLGYEMEITNNFGNFEFAKKTLEEIARGKHGLSQGLLRYAGNVPNAMQTKGVEFPAYLGNLDPAYGLVDEGGQHMVTDNHNAWKYVDPKTGEKATNSVKEWRENVLRGPQIMLYDILGLCKFAKATFDQTASLANQIYGLDLNAHDMKKIAIRTHMMAHNINKKQGFTEEDYIMPERCHESLPGMTIEHFNTKEFFNKVKAGVFEAYKNYKFD